MRNCYRFLARRRSLGKRRRRNRPRVLRVRKLLLHLESKEVKNPPQHVLVIFLEYIDVKFLT